MPVSEDLRDRGARAAKGRALVRETSANWVDTRSDEGLDLPARKNPAAGDTNFLGLRFSRPRAVAVRVTVAASLLVVGLFVTEDMLPGLVGRLVELGTVVTLATLLALCEFARRDVIAARSELVRSEQRLSFAQAASGVGSWEVDAEGTEFWSPSFRDILGVDASTPASTAAFHACVHPDDRDAVASADAEMLREAGKHEFEYRILRPDGEVRCMLARGLCIVDGSGDPQRVFGVAIDLTERKADEQTNRQLEQKLVQAQRLETIGRLAGGIAHDFNNLLTGINGYADLARACLNEGRSPRDEIDEIRVGGARAVALTRQLLAFSRQQVLANEVLDLNAVVRETEKLLGRVIGEDVRIEYVCKRDQVIVSADRTQLEQVIVNLVVNARDSMPGGGRVTVEVDEVDVDAGHALDLAAGPYALLAVTDTGNGMDAETAAQIFEPFYTTKANGTGLGLATVHGIVAQSGGTILIQSEPGHGTTFKIYLPLATSIAEAAIQTEPPASPSPGAGEHVLVVEDDRQVRAIVKHMLVSRGYEVTTAADGTEAIVAAAGLDLFDLILSDLVMPDMGGRELVEKIKALQPAAAVLYMSGYSDDVVRRRGVITASTTLLEKPFTTDDLARRVRNALDTERLAVSARR
jgi:PAS domain S-box-containing protein